MYTLPHCYEKTKSEFYADTTMLPLKFKLLEFPTSQTGTLSASFFRRFSQKAPFV